jgi:RNA polymerase sigma-70 factor (ECF subfamily)
MDKEHELNKTILAHSIDFHNDTEDTIMDADLNRILEKALEELSPPGKSKYLK